MSKAEDFVRKNTKDCSNVSLSQGKYYSWLTPDQARRAVEITREEIFERALTTFQVVCNRPAKLFPNCETYCNGCKQFKQAIKDE